MEYNEGQAAQNPSASELPKRTPNVHIQRQISKLKHSLQRVPKLFNNGRMAGSASLPVNSVTDIVDMDSVDLCGSPSRITENKTQFICDTCSAIDFQWLLQNPDGNFSYTLVYSPQCALCKVLVPHPSDEETWLLRPSGRSWTRPVWVDSFQTRAKDGICLSIHEPNQSSHQAFNYAFCIPSGSSLKGSIPRTIARTVNYTLVKSWLDNCLRCHNVKCGNSFSTIEGLRLVDCETRSIVKAEKPARWVALSYVWGNRRHSDQSETSSWDHGGSSILPARVSQTVEDALVVTKGLGFRYLWVDEYCIEQHNETHRIDQIRKMDQIYHGADLTIVAAAGQDKHHGLPGVGSTYREGSDTLHLRDVTFFNIGPDPKREIANHSKWFKRAWTLQEGVLSKRLLVFTEHQMSFYCQVYSQTEALDESVGIDTASIQERSTISGNQLFSSNSPDHPLPAVREFIHLAELYSRRDLTYTSDTLNAFSGIVHHLGQLDPSLYSIRGLPCYHQPQYGGQDERETVHGPSGLTGRSSLNALTWEAVNLGSLRRKDMFPSWTWAGWYGEIKFRGLYKGTVSLRNVRFEGPYYQILDPFAHMSQSHKHTQNVLDNVTALRFEALVVPPTDFSRLSGSKSRGRRIMSCWSRRSALSSTMEEETIAHLEKGIWSILLLRGSVMTYGEQWFVIIVEWLEGVTAQRVGGFLATSRREEDTDSGLIEEDLEWREVGLV